jgi:hypothetical protein
MRLAPTLVSAAAVAAAAACSRGPELPPPWVAYLRNDSVTASLDPTSVKRELTHARVVLRFDHAAPKGPPGKRYTQVRAEEVLDCRARHIRDIDLRVFDEKGVELDASLNVRRRTWVPFDEHPLGEESLDGACEALGGT